ncbi:MAG: DNA polymerase III subunit alpha, partial [Bdellovibrionales bacterium]|nr:DNA polymerase III subunit alpha [Bdellovibrionales bacterium]
MSRLQHQSYPQGGEKSVGSLLRSIFITPTLRGASSVDYTGFTDKRQLFADPIFFDTLSRSGRTGRKDEGAKERLFEYLALSSSTFVHLHLHTQYSLLDGLNKIDPVIQRAAAIGQPAIAMTDHGNMHGAIQFYESCQKSGIKPIIGCELYVTPGSRHDRRPVSQGGEGHNHLTILAMNNVGYQNLCRLVSLSYREGFYFKPRVDHELLARYHEGLIALSGCLSSEVGELVSRDDIENARKRVEKYSSIFGDRYYLEVQPHQIREQQKLNLGCTELAQSLGIPLVATTDCHYLEEEDHYAQEVLMCISTGKQITDPDRMRHEGVHLYLKSREEMIREFGEWRYADDAVSRSVEIAERCGLSFDFSTYYMPKFEASGETLESLMRKEAREGFGERLKEIKARREWRAEEQNEYEERLEEELDLIEKMGFAGYFLVVSDFIVWAKKQGIPVGPGRGSAAGSLVAYCLRITELDPIEHKLLFERFLNPERVSLPDIDVDFCIHGRDDVIRYVVEKYGKEKVAQIATFGTLKAKAAIKDVGRALGKSYAETDRVAQLVPAPRQGFDYPIEEAIKMEPQLRDYAEGEGRELISLAMKIEGLTRHTSTHAAGVVIGDRPLHELLPMMVDKDGNDVTQ